MSEQAIPAIDVGGTLIKGGLVGPGGSIRNRITRPTGTRDGHRSIVDRIAAVGRELAAAAAEATGRRPSAVGVAIPGLVDEARGRAMLAANFDWSDYPIAAALADLIGTPVVLSHDVTVGALAEYSLGAAAGARAAVVVPIGTGIAAGLVNRGQPYRGAHGRTLELGHLRVPWSDEPCGCGSVGCLERVAAASSIARRYAELTGQPVGGPATPDAKEVGRRAQAGDRAAAQVWHDAVRALAEGLVTVVTLLDPDRIVIAGGLSRAGESLLAPLRAELSDRLTFQVMPDVVEAALGQDAGLVGTAIAAGLVVTAG
ncbi:MAG: ROK family protein [Bifidobacteriaceae bacterium]|nr:ROK family protein [Bifidobacteriaceae bacterium]